MRLNSYGRKVRKVSHCINGIYIIIGMTRLGQCDNVTVKLSGGFATDSQWTHQSAVKVIKDTVQCFGPKKCVILSSLVLLLSVTTGACLPATFQLTRSMGHLQSGSRS